MHVALRKLKLGGFHFFESTIEQQSRLIRRMLVAECENKEITRRGAFDGIALDAGMEKGFAQQHLGNLDYPVVAISEEQGLFFQGSKRFSIHFRPCFLGQGKDDRCNNGSGKEWNQDSLLHDFQDIRNLLTGLGLSFNPLGFDGSRMHFYLLARRRSFRIHRTTKTGMIGW